MFGYITIDREELKGKDFDRYHAYYCGICRDLKERYGERARMTLTYDMTFLAVLLSGLYESRSRQEEHFCILHPTARKTCIRSACTRYAADMNILLVYHNLMDDWLDEKKHMSYRGARLLRGAYLKAAAAYPRQVRAIRRYLKDLHRVEEANSRDIDLASGLTGRLMREIFTPREDEWSRELGQVGFYLGKFIFLMDAYEDLPKDRKNGTYNPFLKLAEEADYEEKASGILTMMAAAAARNFERLPILENVDILRNILYSGIWTKYRLLRGERSGQSADGQSKHEENR
ncbi:MAG TPA: hypothetical protein IAB71_04125 [Candidatus Scatomonas pullistercoris]|uniref:Uncharacterized protein n=1 Tax=Candidatus Scatomonas pullistercoris TaxID=2840920 RepID=A0A9D1P3F0_9FIRM|nr:hypothetical protein [Candidatus Scatomonas pullistercoris]